MIERKRKSSLNETINKSILIDQLILISVSNYKKFIGSKLITETLEIELFN